jgi:hypothetical protein
MAWQRWLSVFLLMALPALIAGTIIAFSNPLTIEEEVVRLSYTQRGDFDYTACLAPSYLFGPEPRQEEPLPSNTRYPVAIIESIDMTFTYCGQAGLSKDVTIDAVLENEGLWQKNLPLMSQEGLTGNQIDIPFELEVRQCNDLFDTIEDELGVAGNRRVAIVANVREGDSVFRQSLPVKLSSTILEIDGDRVLSLDGCSGVFNYTVQLKPNSVFDAQSIMVPVLAAPQPSPLTEVKPGTALLANLLETIDMTFRYEFKCNQPVTDLKEQIVVDALLEGADIWKKSFVLVPSTSYSGDLQTSFSLDITGIRDLLYRIRHESGSAASTYLLTIRVDVLTTANTAQGSIRESFSQTLTADMGKPVFAFREDLNKVVPTTLTDTSSTKSTRTALGLSLPAGRLVFPVLTFIFILAVGLINFNDIRQYRRPVPSYEQQHKAVLKKYGNRLVDALAAVPIEEGRVVQMTSIKELVRVADEIGKPVIHEGPREPGQPHSYLVIDGAVAYQFYPDH